MAATVMNQSVKENGGWARNRTEVHGFAGRCIATLPPSHWGVLPGQKREAYASPLSVWSGKRDSNSRPRPWQGRALPAELFPRGSTIVCTQLLLSSGYSCSVKTGQAAFR